MTSGVGLKNLVSRDLVAFDRFVSDKNNYLNELCEYLNISYHPSMLDSQNYKDIMGKRWLHNTAYKKNKPSWETILDKWEVYLIEALLSSQMKKLGFDLTVSKDDNYFFQFISRFKDTNLLRKRIINYFHTDQ